VNLPEREWGFWVKMPDFGPFSDYFRAYLAIVKVLTLEPLILKSSHPQKGDLT
jgi:hypothetical protein